MAHQKRPEALLRVFFMQKHSFEHRQKASQLPFLLFLRESIDKFRKRVHNKFGKMNMAYRNMACALCAGTEEWGENPRRRNGTVNVGKEAFGAKAQPLAKKQGRRKQPVRRYATEHKVRIFGSFSFWRLSRRSVCKCIKMFAPKFEKNFGAFLLRKPAGAVPLPFFT